MRLHRFYLKNLSVETGLQQSIKITDKNLIHQWLKVFRMKKNDNLFLFNGDGFDYLTKINEINKKEITLNIIDKKINKFSPAVNLNLIISLPKKDKMEWIIEKGTEIGVSTFSPILSEHSEKKEINLERLEKIAIEATEQSGRNSPPQINKLLKLKEVKLNPENFIVFDPSGEKFSLEKIKSIKKINALIGPEGGWGDKELEYFKNNNLKIYSIGSQILRAETATIAISSLILLN